MRRTLAITVVLVGLAFPLVVSGQDPMFEYIAEDTTISYDPATGVASGVVSVFIQEDPASPGFPNQVSGWSMGNVSDPSLVTIMGVEQGEYMLFIDPSFFAPAILANGFTVGCVYDFFGGADCTYEVAKEVVEVTYDTVPGPLVGDLDGETVDLIWSDTLGDPVVENTLVLGSGEALPPVFNDGVINLEPLIEEMWVRGDCNADGSINIADGIFTLWFLFLQGEASTCVSACDGNGDASLDSADAIFMFNYQLLDGPPPPAPFPDCGLTNGDDCESYTGCP